MGLQASAIVARAEGFGLEFGTSANIVGDMSSPCGHPESMDVCQASV